MAGPGTPISFAIAVFGVIPTEEGRLCPACVADLRRRLAEGKAAGPLPEEPEPAVAAVRG